jgi:capsular polysaccharide biosynthesis protein
MVFYDPRQHLLGIRVLFVKFSGLWDGCELECIFRLSFIFIPCFNSATMINLSSSQLRQAADLKEKIEALNTELAALIGGTAPATPAPVEAPAAVEASAPVEAEEPAKPAKRTMSPAHKAAIQAAQALRWAKVKVGKSEPAEKSAKKGGMSAEGRARIIAAQKARWAKYNAAKK